MGGGGGVRLTKVTGCGGGGGGGGGGGVAGGDGSGTTFVLGHQSGDIHGTYRSSPGSELHNKPSPDAAVTIRNICFFVVAPH